MRHLTVEERQEIRRLIEECGPSEVIRTIASLVNHLMEDEKLAESVRLDLNHNAKKLAGKPMRE
jgi:hypothetical protein